MQQTETLLPSGIEEIKTKIHEIRGQKVMIDADLAKLYQVETKVLNQAVKRNLSRFPADAMFVLTEGEFSSLRSQIVTSNKRGGRRYLPFVFTEVGIAMLSSVLTSEIAIMVNLNIMRTFTALRHFASMQNIQGKEITKVKSELKSLATYIDEVLHDQNDINEDTATQLELINQTLAELQTEKIVRRNFESRKPIGFKINDND